LPRTQLQSGALIQPSLRLSWQRQNDAEASAFRPLGIEIDPGDYAFAAYGVDAETDQSKKYAASLSLEAGDYFDGHLLTLESAAQFAPTPRMVLRMAYALNQARRLGPDRAGATSHLLGPELRLALNPRVQLYAFYQYNTLVDQEAWNLRIGWEFRPLSYLYLVVNDSRFYVEDALREVSPARYATQQQVILKVSYLMQL
jgi:hypothetical protein